MQPEFSSAVDPIFLAALKLEARIENNDRIITADERAVLIRKMDEAEGRLGRSEEWKLAKYAISCWIDSKLIENPWAEHEWWKNNCLEAKFFGTRDAHEEFFRKAVDAGALSSKNALEVFYLAVVLGFKGFYGNSDTSYRRQVASRLRIPDTLEGWCREVSKSLQLRSNKPKITGIIQVGGSARPLNGKQLLGLYSMMSILLVALAIVCGIVLFKPFEKATNSSSVNKSNQGN
jgi:type VI secretion system protein ImpK